MLLTTTAEAAMEATAVKRDLLLDMLLVNGKQGNTKDTQIVQNFNSKINSESNQFLNQSKELSVYEMTWNDPLYNSTKQD